jgi:hypothetical protein
LAASDALLVAILSRVAHDFRFSLENGLRVENVASVDAFSLDVAVLCITNAWVADIGIADFDRARTFSVAFAGNEIRGVSLAAALGHRVLVVAQVLAVARSGALTTVPRVLDVNYLSSIASDLAVVVALARPFARDRVLYFVGILDVLAFIENLKSNFKLKKYVFFYLCVVGGAKAWISDLSIIGIVVAATFAVAVSSIVVCASKEHTG